MKQLAPIESLEVLEPPKPTPKQKKQMKEAAAFAKFGVHSLRVKTEVLAALGAEAETAGIKHLGHGKVIVASGNAEEAITFLAKVAEKLAGQEKPDFALVVDVLRLLKEFNAQLISTAQVHLNMAKGIAPQEPAGAMMSFPAGSPLMIAVGKTNPVPVSLEPPKPA